MPPLKQIARFDLSRVAKQVPGRGHRAEAGVILEALASLAYFCLVLVV